MSGKFDPTKFARTSLSETMRDPLDPLTSTPAPAPVPAPVAVAPAAKPAPERPSRQSSERPAVSSRAAASKLRAARAAAPKKVQLNMRLDPTVYERAIDAAARVAGEYSLGDIFAEIIEDFEAAAGRLANR